MGGKQQHDASKSVFVQAIALLREPDPERKAAGTRKVAELWRQQSLSASREGPCRPPDRPGRDDTKVKVIAPGSMHKLGKGGSLASRQAILHSLVHIESWAVDLSWDVIARFGSNPSYALPDEFISDFIQVAVDEASHFQFLQERLETLGSWYGALPVHDGLWESAEATAHSLPARLAVESCVHEARGLDRLPLTIQKFRNSKDAESVELLERIYQEEIAHCAAGVKWLTYLHQRAHATTARSLQQAAVAQSAAQSDLPDASATARDVAEPGLETAGADCGNSHRSGQHAQAQAAAPGACQDETHAWQAHARQYSTVEEWFHALVRANFKGSLKPPFNVEARAAAGFGPEWYLPLAA